MPGSWVSLGVCSGRSLDRFLGFSSLPLRVSAYSAPLRYLLRFLKLLHSYTSPLLPLRQHSLIPIQRFPNLIARQRSLSPDAPMIPSQFHNRARHNPVRLSRIQYQRNPIPQLPEHLIPAGASRRPGHIRASPRQRHSQLFNQLPHNLILRPPQRNPPRIRRHLQRQPVGSIHHHRQRPRPASFRQFVKIVRQLPRQYRRVLQTTDQNWQRPRLRPPLHAKNLVNRRQIHGIGRQRIQCVGRNSNYRAAIQPSRGIADNPWVRIFRANLQHFSRQGPYLTSL